RIVAEARAEFLYERQVLRLIERAEISRGRDMTVAILRADGGDLAFDHRQARNRPPPAVKARVRIHAIKPTRRLADNGGEHNIGFTRGDVSYDRLEFVVAGDHRHVFLSNHLAAAALDQIPHDPIRFARIDVVRADEVEAAAAVLDEV